MQQKGNYGIGTNLDYSSIDEEDYHNSKHHSSNDLSSRSVSRPVFISSTPMNLLDSFASTHEESTMI